MTTNRNSVIDLMINSVLSNPSYLRKVRAQANTQAPMIQGIFYPAAQALENWSVKDRREHPSEYMWAKTTTDDYARIIRTITLACDQSKARAGAENATLSLGEVAGKIRQQVKDAEKNGIDSRMQDLLAATTANSKLDKLTALFRLLASRDPQILKSMNTVDTSFSIARLISGHRNYPTQLLAQYSTFVNPTISFASIEEQD